MKTNDNDERIKEMLNAENVPEELSPENIKKMLDEKKVVNRRAKITHKAARFTAVVAACAVICCFSVHYVGQKNKIDKELVKGVIGSSNAELSVNAHSSESSSNESEKTTQTSFLNGISDYGELYYTLSKKAEENGLKSTYDDYVYTQENAESSFDDGTGIGGGDREYSSTFNQEENVLEADMVQTDGEYIYYIDNENIYQERAAIINIARVENGNFIDSSTVDISKGIEFNDDENMSNGIEVRNMYLHNDMIILVGTYYSFYNGNAEDEKYYRSLQETQKVSTFVSVYTTGIEPQHINTFYQDGYFSDVRITDDGYMYLISDYSSYFYGIEDIDDIEAYVPTYNIGENDEFIPVENIMLPKDEINCYNSIAYTIISSYDLNTSGAIALSEIKALAFNSGSIYCTNDNLYTANGWDNTEITRFAIENGSIEPVASGKVKGSVHNQFSMSEYNGYFRISTTYIKWEETIADDIATNSLTEQNNYLYALDMDLNEVGSITDFGIGESIKAVNFDKDLAYVVTYEQIDPLFAIDVSNPQQPVILDEYKITGFSTYMQQWTEGKLLGFGISADENGRQNGVKLVMFDVSDANDLKETGLYEINGSENSHLYSYANSERKALLIAPEKNLIGIPVSEMFYNESADYRELTKYMFFSYENNEFVYKGEVAREYNYNNENWMEDSYNYFERAVYIDDYVYTLSGDEFISSDINTISEVDTVSFN